MGTEMEQDTGRPTGGGLQAKSSFCPSPGRCWGIRAGARGKQMVFWCPENRVGKGEPLGT